MSAKRGASGLSGVLLVDKPQGLTSHDVVSRVRRLTGERRVGHAGTLDPMATGLLVVLVGPATRLAPYLTAAEKRYIARITFGAQTDTDDAEGRVIATAEVPVEVGDVDFAERQIAALVGTHAQIPPAFSAIKRDGVTSYKAARAGQTVELEARTIEVTDARLLSVVPGEAPAWEIELSVSKGTYIRSIARDLGVALGTVAHLSALRRTASGAYSIADAATLEELEQTGTVRFTDPVAGLTMPVVRLSDEGVLRVATGSPLDPALHCVDCEGDETLAVVSDDLLLAIYRRSGSVLKAQVVIPGGVTRLSGRDGDGGCS